jgi:hypothetical protein
MTEAQVVVPTKARILCLHSREGGHPFRVVIRAKAGIPSASSFSRRRASLPRRHSREGGHPFRAVMPPKAGISTARDRSGRPNEVRRDFINN